MMTESVAFHSGVYNLPVIHGTEDAIVSGEKECYYEVPNSDTYSALIAERRIVRVILGRFGEAVRLSAPEIGVVTEGQNPDEAWAKFLVEISKREDSASLSFDVGPTRRDEIIQGLNAPEDEDWDGLVIDAED